MLDQVVHWNLLGYQRKQEQTDPCILEALYPNYIENYRTQELVTTSFARIRTSLAGINPDDGTRGCWIMAEKEFKRAIDTALKRKKDGSIERPHNKLKTPTTSYPWHVAS